MPPRDFSQLTDEQAREHFEQWVATAPERLEALRGAVAGDTRLDYSPESLVVVWEWFLGRERSRGNGDGELPPWYEPDPPELAAQRLPAATLRDVDLVAAYLAEVFRRNLGLEWAIGNMPARMAYAHQNAPVLKNETIEVEPVSVTYGRAVQVGLLGGEPQPDALLETYRAWVT